MFVLTLAFFGRRFPSICGTVWMRVVARPCFLLGANTNVAPGEADLRLAVLVFASAFSSPTFEKASHTWKVILHGLFSVGEIFLAPDKVVDKFPDTSVFADRIVNDAVVPKQVLDVELVVLG